MGVGVRRIGRLLIPIRGLVALLSLAAVVLVLAACNGSSPTATPQSKVVSSPIETPSFLFVTEGAAGTLDSVEGLEETFLLTIFDTDPTITVFSDRPNRIAHNISVLEFIDNWEGYGFVEDPPNAAAVLGVAEPNADILIVELGSPVWTEATETLVFEARTVGVQTVSAGLGFHIPGADDRLPGTFGQISLFIDSARGCAAVPGANCSGAYLNGKDLRDTDLNNINLSGASLRGADLSRSTLTGANLTGADLHGANLQEADLTDANLTNANLSAAFFAQANLSKAITTGITVSFSTKDVCDRTVRIDGKFITDLNDC